MTKYILLKIISVLIAAFSQILLKKSANKTYDSRIKEYLNILVIVGYGMFFISSILSVISLKGISISYSSIIESLSYVAVPILSQLLLNEKVNNTQLKAIVIIIVGVIVYSI